MKRMARFQQTLASQSSFEKHGRKSKRELFLDQMEQVVPWSALLAPGTNNQLSNQSYDSAGEVTADQYNNSYSYDAEGRLLSAGGGAYAYDGAGNRVKKTVGGNVTLYWPGVPRQNSIRAKQRLDSESGGCFGSGIRQKPGTFRDRKSPRGRCQVVSDCSADAALPQFIFSLEEKSSR